MIRIPKKAVIFFSIPVILFTLAFVAVLNVGSWLKGGDTPVPAWAIVVLAGPPTRSFYAADLYRLGYAKEIYVIRPVRENSLKMLDEIGVQMPRIENIYKEVLLKKGVPENYVHFLGDSCLSTIDEAEAASRIFHGDGCRILVVTSPFHVKRTQMVFQQRMKQCRFRVLATPYEPFPKRWWTDQDSARNVVLETIKIAFYQFGGQFTSSVNKPLNP
jgi:uncharacterized SAM-binding protein YcdF (DUF218 family)